MKKEKGEGTRAAMQLNASQKVSLTLWTYSNKELFEKMSSFDIAERFKAETGITASTSSIITTRNAVFPEMKRTRGKYNLAKFDGNQFIEKMNQLHKRISRIEFELGIDPI